MHVPLVRSLLVPQTSVSWEGQSLGKDWRQAHVCRWHQDQTGLRRSLWCLGGVGVNSCIHEV